MHVCVCVCACVIDKRLTVYLTSMSSIVFNDHIEFIDLVILWQVNVLRRVNHVNLVRLLGYCQDEQQVLIYEFAEEGSLWDHLHGENLSLQQRNWKLKIVLCTLKLTAERMRG